MRKTGYAMAVIGILAGLICSAGSPLLMAGTNDTVQAGLLATLQKPDASHEQKAAACRELAHVGDKAAVPVLAGLLGDEKLAHMARYALEANPDPSVDAAFRAALDKLKGLPLAGVINSLGVRRDVNAVSALEKLLKGPDQHVARSASAALGRIGTMESARVLETAIEAAKGENKYLYEDLLSAAGVLLSGGKESKALGFYERIAKADVPVLLKAAASRGVLFCGGDVNLLVELLNSKEPVMFEMGLTAAQELKGRKVTSAIIFQIGRLPPDKASLLVQILGKRSDKIAVPELKSIAAKGDKSMRLAAIRALGEIGESSSAALLMELMKETDQEIVQLASASLAGLADPDVNDDVIKMLDCPDDAVRAKMLEIAGQRRIKKAMPAMLKAMQDKNEKVRFAAIRNYGALAGPAELPFLLEQIVKSVNAGEIGAYEKALSSICSIGGSQDESVKKLADALPKATVESRQALLRVLRAAGGAEALRAVHTAVGDTNHDVHMTAIRTLSEWKSVDAIPVLLELARNSKEEAGKILSLRGYLGMATKREVAPKARLGICREAALLIKRDEERKMLLGALGSLGDPESLNLIIGYLDEPGVKGDAVSTVLAVAQKRAKKLSPALTRTALEKVVKVAENPAERKLAEELLMKIEKDK